MPTGCGAVREGRRDARWQDSSSSVEDEAVMYRKEIQPICSPAYLAAHEAVLRGVALVWRCCIEGCLDRCALVPVHGEFVPFDGCCVARLTSRSRHNALGSSARGSSRTSPS